MWLTSLLLFTPIKQDEEECEVIQLKLACLYPVSLIVFFCLLLIHEMFLVVYWRSGLLLFILES